MAEAVPCTVSIGAVVGMVVGITPWGTLLVLREGAGLQPDFGIDFASIGGVLVLIYLAVLLVTLVPAVAGFPPSPGGAVRYTE